MKSDLAEKLRGNLITQALIVVLCVSFSWNRHNQERDINELETLYVSYRLLSATLGEVRNTDSPGVGTVPEGLAKDLDAYMTKNPSYQPPPHRVSPPSGGWLRFHADWSSLEG